MGCGALTGAIAAILVSSLVVAICAGVWAFVEMGDFRKALRACAVTIVAMITAGASFGQLWDMQDPDSDVMCRPVRETK
jgi:hypothetical protein